MKDIREKEVKDLTEMLADLEEYYEAAGFADFHNRVLSKMDENQIRAYYHETFEVEEDLELVEWERNNKEKFLKRD